MHCFTATVHFHGETGILPALKLDMRPSTPITVLESLLQQEGFPAILRHPREWPVCA